MTVEQEIKRAVCLKKSVLIDQARGGFINFVEYINENYDTQWFHELIADYLQRLQANEIRKLMIFVPPQHGKSELSSRQFAPFCLGKNPDEKIAVCSYSPMLASSFNRNMQMIMDSPEYAEVFPETRLNSKNVSTDARNGVLRNTQEFEVVGYRGGVKTIGVGQNLTGYTVDLGIIDDPFKDRTIANSPVMRQRLWDWYLDVFSTRLHNDSRQLMLFTRWHEDDLAGRLINPENQHYDEKIASEWTIIAIPALKESESPITSAIELDDPREIDEALWEAKHSKEELVKKKRANVTSFNCLYQQRPSAQEGNKIKREWFEVVSESQLPFNPQLIKCDYFIDGAFTDKTANDETAILSCYHYKTTGELYIFNVEGVRKEMYELIDYFKSYVQMHHYAPNSSVYIELKASGYPLKSMLSKPEHGSFNVRKIDNKVVALGKWNRVESIEPFLAAGKVKLVKGIWNARFVDQCASFPNGALDDMVDVLCYSVLNAFFKKTRAHVTYG